MISLSFLLYSIKLINQFKTESKNNNLYLKKNFGCHGEGLVVKIKKLLEYEEWRCPSSTIHSCRFAAKLRRCFTSIMDVAIVCVVIILIIMIFLNL